MPLRFFDIQWIGRDGKPRMNDKLEPRLMERLNFWHRLIESHPNYNIISGMFSNQAKHTEL